MCDVSVAGDYFRNITAGLTENGVDVLLVELGPGTAPPWLPRYPNARYFSLGAARKAAYPLAVRRLARLLKNEGVNILHTHLFYSGLIGVLAKRLAPNVTVALMRHHTAVVRLLGSGFHVRADKWMAERADHVMAVSEAARAYMRDVDGVRRDDIEVVYLGFDFEQMSPNADKRVAARAEFGFTGDDLVIGYVGNLAHGKGHLQLIQAFEKISSEMPNARLLFAGRGMLPEVEAAAAEFPAGKIVFGGWQDDISACYNAMDIFVQPSLSEAFSQVLVEAMGCGLPVIATNVGGASEVIESGVNGILIDPNDVQAIAREVLHLIRDAAFRRNLAANGMRSVRERFSAETMVERHVKLYRQLTENTNN